MGNGCARGQMSTEILILVGMALFLLMPVLLYAYGRANVSGEDLSVQKAEFAAHRLASLADSVGYLGGGAKVIDEIEVPPYVKSVRVNGRDIVIDMDSASGKKQIVAGSAFNLTSTGFERITKSGTYFIEVSALSAMRAAPDSAQVGLSVQ
ncbi:MAG: hypothetical protein NTX79_06960 [Candidatus Micrarchaeota archaeon]|nr:hypothetical protein [Candidatus Micrarchaeota archaeon]